MVGVLSSTSGVSKRSTEPLRGSESFMIPINSSRFCSMFAMAKKQPCRPSPPGRGGRSRRCWRLLPHAVGADQPVGEHALAAARMSQRGELSTAGAACRGRGGDHAVLGSCGRLVVTGGALRRLGDGGGRLLSRSASLGSAAAGASQQTWLRLVGQYGESWSWEGRSSFCDRAGFGHSVVVTRLRGLCLHRGHRIRPANRRPEHVAYASGTRISRDRGRGLEGTHVARLPTASAPPEGADPPRQILSTRLSFFVQHFPASAHTGAASPTAP